MIRPIEYEQPFWAPRPITMAEKGHGLTNRGWAEIIARPDGGKPTAYHTTYGMGKDHAYVEAANGYYFIRAELLHREWSVHVYTVMVESGKILLLPTYTLRKSTWTRDGSGEIIDAPPEFLAEAVAAAKEKARCYHCRSAHWVAKEEN